MIGYGAAFVVGYLVSMGLDLVQKRDVSPWSLGNLLWGGLFMALNWVATLGV